jgi:hypothetical protein
METIIVSARIYCKYRARHLCPPDQRRGPDRWMNLSGTIDWFEHIKERLDALHKPTSTSKKQAPRFGFTQRQWQEAKDEYNKKDGTFYRLQSLCGKEFTTQAEYEQAVQEKCPQIKREVARRLAEQNDLNRSYLEEISAGCEGCWEGVAELSKMLECLHAIQRQTKKAGLTKAGIGVCQEIYDRANLAGSGKEVVGKVVEEIARMGENLGEQERILVTSDVIETVNGKWKMLIGGNAMPALGVNTLLVPTLMGEITADELKTALATVSTKDVAQWNAENIGVSFHQEKRSKKKVSMTKLTQDIIF